MIDVRLPRLLSSVTAVDDLLVDEIEHLHGAVVVLNGRDLRAATPSSAREFVKVVLVDGGASRLELVGLPEDFELDIEVAARAHGVEERVHRPPMSVG